MKYFCEFNDAAMGLTDHILMGNQARITWEPAAKMHAFVMDALALGVVPYDRWHKMLQDISTAEFYPPSDKCPGTGLVIAFTDAADNALNQIELPADVPSVAPRGSYEYRIDVLNYLMQVYVDYNATELLGIEPCIQFGYSHAP